MVFYDCAARIVVTDSILFCDSVFACDQRYKDEGAGGRGGRIETFYYTGKYARSDQVSFGREKPNTMERQLHTHALFYVEKKKNQN